jgi:hypothetical protein
MEAAKSAETGIELAKQDEGLKSVSEHHGIQQCGTEGDGPRRFQSVMKMNQC